MTWVPLDPFSTMYLILAALEKATGDAALTFGSLCDVWLSLASRYLREDCCGFAAAIVSRCGAGSPGLPPAPLRPTTSKVRSCRKLRTTCDDTYVQQNASSYVRGATKHILGSNVLAPTP